MLIVAARLFHCSDTVVVNGFVVSNAVMVVSNEGVLVRGIGSRC
jgi:hypothetical protein